MQNSFWIYLFLVFFFQIVDNQHVVGQNQSTYSEDEISNFILLEGLQIHAKDNKKKDKTEYPVQIIAESISKSNKELQKINSSNWHRQESEDRFFQKLSIPSFSQVFIGLKEVRLDSDEYVEVLDLVNGNVIDEINEPSGFKMLGPYLTEEIGLILHSRKNELADQVLVDEVYIGAMDFGYNSSYECHKNISCEEGELFSDEERGIVRILMVLSDKLGFCSGSLVNNTEEDRIPYVLSAFHCKDVEGLIPLYDQWSYDFAYESFSCADPETEPSFVRVTGSELVAGYEPTDMLLLKITSDLPDNSNAFFNGWNRDDNYEAPEGVMIHHPNGDIKKVSVEKDAIVPFESTLSWDNGITTPPGSHLVTQFDESSYQGGSSGAPLLDYNGHIIGQLHGGPDGDETCSIGIGYHGKFSQSWEGGGTPESRLKDWLDPNNTENLTINGVELNETGSSFLSLVGRLVTPDGIAIPNVRVSIKGDKEASFMTGPDGRFVFDDLPKSGAYTLEFAKITNPGNGVSAIDVVQIMNHILGTNPLFGTFQQRSADANNDGQVSSVDLVQILNVIIGKSEMFPNNTSWKFEPPFIHMTPENSESFNRQIIGYKIGDVNFSADPRR